MAYINYYIGEEGNMYYTIRDDLDGKIHASIRRDLVVDSKNLAEICVAFLSSQDKSDQMLKIAKGE